MTTRQIQLLLAYLGYEAAPDGIPGHQTEAAVREFQRDYGLPEDGDPGRNSQMALKDSVAYDKFRPEKDAPAPSPDAFDGPEWWDEIEYFSRDEKGIRCPCGRCGGFPVEPSETLMRMADRVRSHFGRPMIPSSTVRCQQHNDSLRGSVPNSLHLKGKAMDFSVSGFSAASVLAYVQHLSGVNYAYAIDRDFVHMDVK